MAISTINSHLSEYLEEGLLSIEQFLTSEKMDELTRFFKQKPNLTFAEAKEQLGDSVKLSELGFFMSYWRWKKKESTVVSA